jgi:hypothetical protein
LERNIAKKEVIQAVQLEPANPIYEGEVK